MCGVWFGLALGSSTVHTEVEVEVVRDAVAGVGARRSPSASVGSGQVVEVRRSGLSSAYQGSAWHRWRKEKQAAIRRQNERYMSALARAASSKEVP